METVDTKTLIHVGVELVVIGGLTFWFQRKTSLLHEEIDDLRGKLSKLEDIINQQGKMLNQHEQFIQMIGRGMPPQMSGPRHQGMPPQNMPTSRLEPEKRSVPNQPRVHQPRVEQPQEDDSEENISESELDSLLGDEINQLHKSRQDPKDDGPEFIEIECNGDSCDLKKPRSKSKSISKKKSRKG